MLLMQAQENGAVLDEEELLFLAGEQTNTFDADVDDQPVRDLAQNDDNIFQTYECDAFDSYVDDEPTTQSIFMANLSLAGPENLQVHPSNASILSEVHDLENTIDHYDDNQDEDETHNKVQQKHVIDSNGVDKGAQNPFYLRKAKMVQPALYDGDEILKMHHVPVNVTSSEEDLDIVEITRQKMNDPVCVEKKIKIIPPNYSKENFLATFTPQTQLTPEQVFWSKDLLKQRVEDLKTNSPPLPILPPAIVYPPNTPVHLVH
ncbi:hypothetical protein Tco_0812482 [Tanacetum coccineum]